MKWRRKWPCASCGGDLIYDDAEETVTCNCGTSPVLNSPKSTLELRQNYTRFREKQVITAEDVGKASEILGCK